MPRYQAIRTNICVVLLCSLICVAATANNLFPSAPRLTATFDQEPSFLPAEQAFKLTASGDNDTLQLRWQIAQGYYLYQHRTQLTQTNQIQSPIALQFPDGTAEHDEYFGDVTAYYDALELTIPLNNIPQSSDSSRVVRLVYQGCASAGLCYPPQKRIVTIEQNGTVLLSKSN